MFEDCIKTYFKGSEYEEVIFTNKQSAHNAVSVIHERASEWAKAQQSLSAYYDVDSEAAEAHAAIDKMPV